MPFIFEKFDPPPLSRIRERLLESKLATVDDYIVKREAALQASASRGLSPGLRAVNAQELNSFRDLRANLGDELNFVKLQNEAVTKNQSRLKALADDPLDRSRIRHGFFRSSNERNAAILGILERERRQNAPLTRGAFDRAKAIAASRRLYDPESSQLRGSRGSAYSPSASDIDTSTGFDPCVDRKRVRREVMFAQNTAGIGYRGKGRRRWPC